MKINKMPVYSYREETVAKRKFQKCRTVLTSQFDMGQKFQRWKKGPEKVFEEVQCQCFESKELTEDSCKINGAQWTLSFPQQATCKTCAEAMAKLFAD